MKPKISIVIPVKNGMDTLPRLMEGIQTQSLFSETEVVVVDSGSTDNSVEYLSQYPFVRIVPIDPKTFNHGATRNLGVQHVQGEFIAMTVQDATPYDPFWLQTMHEHFEDREVVGVCGQQIVPQDSDKNPHEWFRPQSQPSIKIIQFKIKEDFDQLSPVAKRSVCGWDDVNAMYRTSVLKQIPFETTAYGEDMLWAKAALEKGHKLVYDYSARVYHYHFQFPEYTYRRVLISKLFTYNCFGYAKPQGYGYKDYVMIVLRNMKWKLHPKWIFHNIKIIYYNRKATRDFLDALKKNRLNELEKELALNIPLGKQNKKP